MKWVVGASSIVAVLALLLSGCGQPVGVERALQSRLSEIVQDRARCPTGGSQDLQALLKSASQEGVVTLAPGCYEIEDPVVVPHGTQVIGAGREETILYRDPEAAVGKGGSMLLVYGRSEERYPYPHPLTADD